MEPNEEHQMEDCDCRTRPFVAHSVGQEDLSDDGTRWRTNPGRKPGVTHKLLDGSEFVHPDAVGADLKHTFKVICLDRQTGKILWERVAYEGAVHDSRHKKASFASSTPATDGKYVFAFFGSEGLYAYDFNGKLVWKQNLGKLGTASVGYGVSPILYKNLGDHAV